MLLGLVAAVAASAAGPALAGYRMVGGDWMQVGLLDPAQIEILPANQRRFWLVQVRKTSDIPGLADGAVYKALWEIDCAGRKARFTRSMVHDRELRLLHEFDFPDSIWEGVSAGSSVESTLEFACGTAEHRADPTIYPDLGERSLERIVSAIFSQPWPEPPAR